MEAPPPEGDTPADVTVKEEPQDADAKVDTEFHEAEQSSNVQGAETAPGSNSALSGVAASVETDTCTSESPAPGPTPTTSQWTCTRCIICSQVLSSLVDSTPQLMECLHSICESCIQTRIEERAHQKEATGSEGITITCPVCRINCSVSHMIDQRFIIEKRDGSLANTGSSSDQQKCTSCNDEENIPTSWCCECAEFICDVCVKAHQRLKITKDHTIKSKEEALNEINSATNTTTSSSLDMFCKEHPQERLALFCETCDRLTCRDCQLSHHRDHRYQFTTEMAEIARTTISCLLSEVSYKRVLLGSAMKVIKDRQDLIAEKKKALVHDITQTVVKVTNAINTRGKQLVLKLNEICDNKLKTLDEKKTALEQLSAITDHCIEFVNAALAQGSDIAVLYSKKQVTDNLLQVKSKRADIPNPEIPVRIQLALDKVPDLIKVVSTIGGIIVDGKLYASSSGNRSASEGPSPQSQGPYHPPVVTTPTSSNSSIHSMQQHQGVVSMAQTQNLLPGCMSQRQQTSPAPTQQQQYQQVAQVNAGVSQLAHLSHMSAQLQRQNSANSMMGPLGAVHPHTVGLNRTGGPIIRHPHVTSSTHPHHIVPSTVDSVNMLAGMQVEMNLKGLLSQPPSYSHATQQQHQLQQQRLAQQNNQYNRQALQAMGYQNFSPAQNQNMYMQRVPGPPVSGGKPRAPSPHAMQHHQQQQQLYHMQQATQNTAKWHIPQQATTNGLYPNNEMNNMYALQQMPQAHPTTPTQDSFKITIRQPPSVSNGPVRQTPAVTSTNPKTPSPNTHSMNVTDAAAHSLDKLCQDSVNDLMATIAKLDSNGVQVLAENAGGNNNNSTLGAGKGASPLVHSSTDDMNSSIGVKQIDAVISDLTGIEDQTADPNEDWCAVCMDGGELMCCDKCPKVFHQYCHIPAIDKLPDETETWQCLLCFNFADIPEESPGDKRALSLTSKQQKVIERIVLEMYCQYEISQHFRESIPLENTDYYNKIKRPMTLDTIRKKLQPRSGMQYTHVSQLVADCRLMFRNAYAYNPVDSAVYKDAKRLEDFFDQQLEKWLPEYAYNDHGITGVQEESAKRAKFSSPHIISANSLLE